MNQPDRKKTSLIIIITLVTVVLGCIAVITAMRLRQLATVPVTPNVPQSRPLAVEPTAVPTPTSSQVVVANNSFETGDFTHWELVDMHSADTFVVDEEENQAAADGRYFAKLVRAEGGTDAHVASDWIEVNKDVSGKKYRLSFEGKAHTGVATVSGIVLQRHPEGEDWTDVGAYLPSIELTTTWETISHEVTFPTPANGNASTQIRVVLRPNDPDTTSQPVYFDHIQLVEVTGNQSNLACVQEFTVNKSSCNQWCDDNADCAQSLTCLKASGQNVGVCRNSSCNSETDCTCAQTNPTPTPTQSASCNESCDSNDDCSGDLTCVSGSCRNPSCNGETDCSCPGPTNTPAPTTPLSSCNQSCSDDADCSGDNVCSSGVCRNPSCTSKTDCSCTSSTVPSPTSPTQLPQAGVETPTVILFSVGILILAGGLVGLFLL